jgi:hypothetical protein
MTIPNIRRPHPDNGIRPDVRPGTGVDAEEILGRHFGKREAVGIGKSDVVISSTTNSARKSARHDRSDSP